MKPRTSRVPTPPHVLARRRAEQEEQARRLSDMISRRKWAAKSLIESDRRLPAAASVSDMAGMPSYSQSSGRDVEEAFLKPTLPLRQSHELRLQLESVKVYLCVSVCVCVRVCVCYVCVL
jgi:hypothetical protein